jgi:tetratricopeptide (TPR) repeat protein
MIKVSDCHDNLNQFDLWDSLAEHAFNMSKLLPADHFLRGISLVRIGEVKARQGLYTLARQYLQEAIAILNKGIAQGHPYVLNALRVVTLLCKDLQQLEEAKQYSQQIVNYSTLVFGAHHSISIIAQQILAQVHLYCNELDQAERLLSQVKAHNQGICG